MNGKSLAALVSLCLCVLLASPAAAHPVPKQNHDRYLVVRLTPTAVVVEYRLEVDEGHAAIDLPNAELVKVNNRKDLFPVFRDYFADVLAKNLDATLDGQPLEFRCVARKHEVTDHLRCDYRMEAACQLRSHAAHAFTFRENNYELEDFNRLHLALAVNERIKLQTLMAPDEALLARRPEDYRPGDGELLRKLSATFRLVAAEPAGRYKPALPPDYAELKSEPEDAAAVAKSESTGLAAGDSKPFLESEATGIGAGDSKPYREAMPADEGEGTWVPELQVADLQVADAVPADEGEGTWSLLNLLLDSKQGFGVLLLLAAAFGGVHALTPGHGKTLVAAYLVGERGTTWHALLLGIVTTVTHTFAVLIIATGLLFFPHTNPASIKFVLEFGGGILVLSLGFWLLYTRLTGRADHVHLGGGHHHHHGGDHDHQHHAEWTTAAGKPSVGALLILGFKGGMVPCWDAIFMLGFAISSGRLWLGLPLLLAFSAGLAGVLTALGVSVVHARNFAGSRITQNERFKRFFRALPLLSAIAITLVGLWLCYDGLHAR